MRRRIEGGSESVVERRAFGAEKSVDVRDECGECGMALLQSDMSVWYYRGTKLIGIFCSLECSDKAGRKHGR